MTRITFYFSAPDKLDVARKLASKAFAAGGGVLMYTRDPARARELDLSLWTIQPLSFLPHVACGHPLARQTSILIGTEADELASPNILINLDDEVPACLDRFQRMLEIVSTDPEDRERARSRYRSFKERGYALETHDLAEKS
jgi:DNA polymerase-3 subunit chi